MTSEAFSRPTLNRRRFLGAALAAGVVLVAESTPIAAYAAAGDVTLTAGGISLLASPGGRLAIRDAPASHDRPGRSSRSRTVSPASTCPPAAPRP
jgi:hypothetical protein